MRNYHLLVVRGVIRVSWIPNEGLVPAACVGYHLRRYVGTSQVRDGASEEFSKILARV